MSKNTPKTTKIEGYIHVFGLSRGLNSGRRGMPPWDMKGH